MAGATESAGPAATLSPLPVVQQLYEATAEGYAKSMSEELHKDQYNARLERFVSLLPDDGKIVVDLGCGPGDVLVKVKQLAGKGQFIGVDLSTSMVELAKSKLDGSTDVTFTQGEVLNFGKVVCPLLQPPSQSSSTAVSGIISYFVIHHLNADEVSALLEECSAHLRPGGRLLLGFWHGSGNIEYPAESNMTATFHQLSDVSDACKRFDLDVTRADVEPDPDMGMDMGFVEAVKK